MPSLSPELAELARAFGVATGFDDWRGAHREVSAETITAVLAAMGVDAGSTEAAAQALDAREQERWRRTLPACLVVRHGSATPFHVLVDSGGMVELVIELETGGVRDDLRRLPGRNGSRQVDGRIVEECTVELPGDLPAGYHTLRARSGTGEQSAALIVTPSWLGLPERLGQRRAWGFAVQLYSVRSRESWGVGDLADLADLAVWSARLGAGYILVNPLHAAEPVAPMEPSPYLPTSRRFFNPLYLRPERIPEYVDLPPAARRRIGTLRNRLHQRLDDADTVDRDTAWTAKREALRLVHALPRSAGRQLDYRGFVDRGGQALTDFAAWSVIAEEHGNDFHAWPRELRDPSSAAVARVRDEHADAVDFQRWLQWVLDDQLQAAQAKAVGAGMELGVLHDLAVGVHPGGADAWRLPDCYAQRVQVGAPPDAFNQVGQDWSQPPWRPDRLTELGYAPLRELIRTVLRHAGGIRVDHVIGLFRLWWIPAGRPPSEGTYVRYDHEALLGILALEAHRAGAVVVGEDLGVVEPDARDYLASRGILGTSVLWFERDSAGSPLPAERWRELCLASVTTHDLPPTAGYLAAEHVRLRDALNLLTRPLAEETAADEGERRSWLAELRDRGLVSADADEEETVAGLHRYLTLTPARLLCAGLADAVGDRRTQNQPGTTDEYPNWRVPLAGPDRQPLLLEDVLESPRAARLAATLRAD